MTPFLLKIASTLGTNNIRASPKSSYWFFLDYLTIELDSEEEDNPYNLQPKEFFDSDPFGIIYWKKHPDQPYITTPKRFHSYYILIAYNLVHESVIKYDLEEFLDEFLTIVPIVQHNYITQTLTLPSYNRLKKFIEEEYEHDTDNTTA